MHPFPPPPLPGVCKHRPAHPRVSMPTRPHPPPSRTPTLRSMSGDLTAAELVTLLDSLFSAYDKLVESRGLEKIKTAGDAYIMAGNLFNHPPNVHCLCVEAGLKTYEVLKVLNQVCGPVPSCGAGGARMRVSVGQQRQSPPLGPLIASASMCSRSMPQHPFFGAAHRGLEACRSMPQHPIF